MNITDIDDGFSVPVDVRLTTGAAMPVYGTSDSAGADLVCAETITIQPHETALVKLNVAFAIPRGFFGLICPRSSIGKKTPLRMPNSVGIIDADYRGDVCAMYTNTGTEPYKVAAGDRIAQIIFVPFARAIFVPNDNLSETERGTGGFGSTGK